MAAHVIRMPDSKRGWEPRKIVWDQDAGTVAGEHSRVPKLRAWIERIVENGGMIQRMNGHWLLEDPLRNPPDFVLTLYLELGPVCWDPEGLPRALRGLEAPPFVEYPLEPGRVQ